MNSESSIAPERLELLQSLADTLARAPENRKAVVFMQILQSPAYQGLSFTAQEKDMLFSLLIKDLSPEQRKKAEMIRRLSSRTG